jgi:hypothetical protein
MLKCEYCGLENVSCSTYNPDHKMECSFCRSKRIGIYGDLSKEDLIKKIENTHRELHCISLNSKSAWAMLEIEQKIVRDLKEMLNRWLIYGENTNCESEPLISKTKKLLNK